MGRMWQTAVQCLLQRRKKHSFRHFILQFSGICCSNVDLIMLLIWRWGLLGCIINKSHQSHHDSSPNDHVQSSKNYLGGPTDHCPQWLIKNPAGLLWFLIYKWVKTTTINTWPFGASLTWQFLRCSWVRRQQSSGLLPPNWSHPPPRSDRSPESCGDSLQRPRFVFFIL